MRNRNVGLIVIGIVVLIGFLVYSFNTALTGIVNTSCSHGPSCPMWGDINFQTDVGIALMAVLFIVGAYLVLTDRGATQAKAKLLPDEKKVYDAIASAGGTIFQSELTEKTGFTKVQLTRLLDRLEGKGVATRMRRGMTNVVILRQ
jgi:uncharacterized membrane protein